MDKIEKTLALIGWAMYYEGYTKEQLDSLETIRTMMLIDDYERWLQREKKEK